MNIIYLWRNRERPNNLSRLCIVLAKRLILFAPLVLLLIRPLLLRYRGAHVGPLVILGNTKITGNLKNFYIGDQSSLGRCEITLHDTVHIGRCVVINDGAILLTASHSLSDPSWRHKKSPIDVGDYAWIATNAIILPGVSIGIGAVIGAGAVVRSDVPEYAIVTGNPATIQSIQRSRGLKYSPVFFNAPFEAWIGRNIKNIDER